LPTLGIPKAVGWKEGAAPAPAQGLAVAPFATGLDHPRQLLLLANGDVLVAESRTEGGKPKGLRDWIMQKVQKRTGALGPSADRVTLLRDADGDGRAEFRSVLVSGVKQPFGMAVVGNVLYVGATDGVVRYPFTLGQTRIEAAPVKLVSTPTGGHWTRSLLASADGSKLYVGVGSLSNVPKEDGWDAEKDRAAVWELDLKTGTRRIFASGLRNPNSPAWEPVSKAMWVVVNERDELGDDLVPDYMTSVKDGGFYGWPYSYYGQHVDQRVKPQDPQKVAAAIKPDYALGAHTASLGLHFYTGDLLGPTYKGGAFVGQHGSWNRTPVSGYKVVFVPFANGRPSGMPQDILTGFLSQDGKVQGRPVGVAQDRTGALLVADDVGNTVWRVAPAR
jgi:glucose/arabinose dehydrogenase